MSKIIVLPDIHLKPWMFDEAKKKLEEYKTDECVFLGDLIDDWDQQANADLYKKTFEAAIQFFTDYPKARFCIGNHDISYVWEKLESGFSHFCIDICQHYMNILQNTLKDRMAFVHKIGNIVFPHGGVNEYFVRTNIGLFKDDEEILNYLNMLPLMQKGKSLYWDDISPIWYRPDYGFKMWNSDKYLQIAGHTPVRKAYQQDSLVICDTFSTFPDGNPIGNCKFIMADSETKEWNEI